VCLPAVKLDSCNNLLSSVHTAFIILRSVSVNIKRKYYYLMPVPPVLNSTIVMLLRDTLLFHYYFVIVSCM